mmetsp:Transcript_15113/g.39007  ORF Transcript_15113/g.39007 Transcript_15113/m.39007 type:complete len:88 (-) Transcript_15113:510-773(-)
MTTTNQTRIKPPTAQGLTVTPEASPSLHMPPFLPTVSHAAHLRARHGAVSHPASPYGAPLLYVGHSPAQPFMQQLHVEQSHSSSIVE